MEIHEDWKNLTTMRNLEENSDSSYCSTEKFQLSNQEVLNGTDNVYDPNLHYNITKGNCNYVSV